LEDFTYGMKRPCICDLKMGPQTFESDASLIKRVQMGAFDKMSTSSNLGFRMCGMRVRIHTFVRLCFVLEHVSK
jgi:1D-myo-inositol-tetrakisphosphate 5-kinase/inositol-polyphosphate multikinase